MNKFIFLISIFFSLSAFSEQKYIYLAGGCFWCLEEAYQEEIGIISAISGYSGGSIVKPTYKQVSSGSTNHIEALEVIYDDKVTNLNHLLSIFFKNIDPFDGIGQFCDKGYQYRSAIFVNSLEVKELAVNLISIIENNHNQKVKTLILDFDKFYEAESYHQDYYKKNPIRYSYYKKACGRQKRIDKILINLNE